MNGVICPNCKGHNINKVRKLTYNNIYKCQSCLLGFQYPLWKKEDIENYYEESVYPTVWGKYNNSFGKMKKITYKWIFSQLPPGKNKTLLDIGTGYGFCLAEAKKKKYSPIGIEPSKDLAKIARLVSNTPIINKFFEDAELKNKFDVVSLFDVIEHLTNPWKSIKKIANLIKANGLLVITTPDYGSLSAKVLGKYWFHLKNEHYYYLSCKTLFDLLTKEGFEIVKCIPQKRPLSLSYIENHFRIYPIPLFSMLLHNLLKLLPRELKEKVFTTYDGNLLLIAKKISIL